MHIISRCAATVALVAAALLSQPVFALQKVDVTDGRAHVVTISAKELTRLSVDGARITRLDYIDGELDAQKVPDGSYLFLPQVTKPINVFVTTSSGRTHALVLQQLDIPLESIVLEEPASRLQTHQPASPARASALESAIKHLIGAMATKSSNDGEFDVTTVNDSISLWAEARFVLVERFSGGQFVGEHYQLTNISKTEMRLAEQELFKTGVVAVAIERHVLLPGETTDVFVLKVSNDG